MRAAQVEYVLEYRHDGQLWGLNFFAVDDEDAERKVESLRATLVLNGRLIGRGDTLEEAAEEAARTEAATFFRRI